MVDIKAGVVIVCSDVGLRGGSAAWDAMLLVSVRGSPETFSAVAFSAVVEDSTTFVRLGGGLARLGSNCVPISIRSSVPVGWDSFLSAACFWSGPRGSLAYGHVETFVNRQLNKSVELDAKKAVGACCGSLTASAGSQSPLSRSER
jgi:hypothetical protein